MKNRLLTILALAAGSLWIPGSALGHHGWAAFESEVQVTFKGTVTDFHFVNPHSVVEFLVKDDTKDGKGQVHKWEGEMTSPSHLVPRGWTAASLEAGDEVTITGYRAKNGTASMRVTRIVLSNGKEFKQLGGGN